jgi:hypothetical protein
MCGVMPIHPLVSGPEKLPVPMHCLNIPVISENSTSSLVVSFAFKIKQCWMQASAVPGFVSRKTRAYWTRQQIELWLFSNLESKLELVLVFLFSLLVLFTSLQHGRWPHPHTEVTRSTPPNPVLHTIHELEQVLIWYLKGGNLVQNRPAIRIGGLHGYRGREEGCHRLVNQKKCQSRSAMRKPR